MNAPSKPIRPEMGIAVRRALLGRCPNCGKGKLFSSYLSPVNRCSVCNEFYGDIRTDDAAPWITILLVGLIAVPIVLAVESSTHWPLWVSLSAWLLFALTLTLALLPRAKACLIAITWSMQTPGSGGD